VYDSNVSSAERQALESFKMRMKRIEDEVQSIDQSLARRDILSLAHRTRDAIRETRKILDKNVEILFAGRPPQFHQDLYDQLEYAEAHVVKALSDEVDFQQMERRLYLATRLADDVLGYVSGAVGEMENRLDGQSLE
jgi:cell division protein FtsI/penicillin-binding protein 2